MLVLASLCTDGCCIIISTSNALSWWGYWYGNCRWKDQEFKSVTFLLSYHLNHVVIVDKDWVCVFFLALPGSRLPLRHQRHAEGYSRVPRIRHQNLLHLLLRRRQQQRHFRRGRTDPRGHLLHIMTIELFHIAGVLGRVTNGSLMYFQYLSSL